MGTHFVVGGDGGGGGGRESRILFLNVDSFPQINHSFLRLKKPKPKCHRASLKSFEVGK